MSATVGNVSRIHRRRVVDEVKRMSTVFGKERTMLTGVLADVDDQLGQLARVGNELSTVRAQITALLSSLDALEQAPQEAVARLVTAASHTVTQASAMTAATFSAPSAPAATKARAVPVADPFSPPQPVRQTTKPSTAKSAPVRTPTGAPKSTRVPLREAVVAKMAATSTALTSREVAELVGEDSPAGRNRTRMVLARLVKAGDAVCEDSHYRLVNA